MSNDTYSKAIKAVLNHLGIASSHWVHLGRVTGSKLLDLKEESSEEIRRLGNWNPTIHEVSYSAKLPMLPMRKIAGYTTASGMYFNPRMTIVPEKELLLMTPFAFAFDVCEQVEELVANGNSGAYTALCFLRFLKDLATVLLQDSAAIWVLHPDRKTHPVFTLDVFATSNFAVSFVVVFVVVVVFVA